MGGGGGGGGGVKFCMKFPRSGSVADPGDRYNLYKGSV